MNNMCCCCKHYIFDESVAGMYFKAGWCGNSECEKYKKISRWDECCGSFEEIKENN